MAEELKGNSRGVHAGISKGNTIDPVSAESASHRDLAVLGGRNSHCWGEEALASYTHMDLYVKQVEPCKSLVQLGSLLLAPPIGRPHVQQNTEMLCYEGWKEKL